MFNTHIDLKNDKCPSLEMILIKFNIKKVELSPELKEAYEKENASRLEMKGTDLEKIFKTDPLSEKEFYLGKLKQSIKYNRWVQNLKICKTEGHIESEITLADNGTYFVCKRCKLGYNRAQTNDESEAVNKIMHTYVNI
jgi:hypothetical protein